MNEPFFIGASLLSVVAAYYQKKFNDIKIRINNAISAFVNSTSYDSLFIKYGNMYSVDPTLLKSIVYWESEFNPNAVSSSNAQGLGQFKPEIWNWIWTYIIQKSIPSPFNPEASIWATAAYFRYLLNKFNNNTILALVSYNAGETKVNRLLNQLGGDIRLVLGKVGSEAAYYGTAIPDITTYAKASGVGL